jgi:hypothetical protein
LGAEVLGHGVDQLLEAPFGRNAQLHAGQAVEHGALGPELLDQLPRPIEEGIGRVSGAPPWRRFQGGRRKLVSGHACAYK